MSGAWAPNEATPLSLAELRGSFAALGTLAWLDTPGCPPAAEPVVAATRAALDSWETGAFSWIDWDEVPDLARRELSGLLGVDEDSVALVGSVSEAAATVARSLPHGARVLVDAQEFRSNLLPWTAPASRGELTVVSPADRPGSLTERLCEHIVEDIDLVAVSTALTSTGARPDLPAVIARSRAVGAQVFVNATQTAGILPLDIASLGPDFVAGHGYKGMLAPRGCAWLVVRPDRLAAVDPLAPGWHTVDRPNADYFGADRPLSVRARKLDGGLPWLPWLGGYAALRLLHRLDPNEVATRALNLACEARQGLEALGLVVAHSDLESHILRAHTPMADRLVAFLRERGVIVSGSSDSLRIGFHGFNDQEDVTRLLGGVEAWQSRTGALRNA